MVSSESIAKLFVISKKNLVLFLGLFLISWIVAGFLWWQFEIDKSILFALNNSNFSNGFAKLNLLISSYGMPSIVFIYLLYILAGLKLDSMKQGNQIFVLILFSFALAGIAGDLLKEVIQRVRPIYEFPNQLTFLTDSQSPSFPSGHATKAVALVIPFLFYAKYEGTIHNVIKVFLALVAGWVCLSRIILGAHYLSDVLGGFGMAFAVLPVALLVANSVIGKLPKEKFDAFPQKWIFIYIALIVLLIMI